MTAIRTGIAVKAGECENIDIGLSVAVGCCEYVAVELGPMPRNPGLRHKKKPFTYTVGDLPDQAALEEVAKLA